MALFFKPYFICLIIFSVIDGVWLGLIAKNLYAEHLGFLMKTPPNWIAAVVFYLLFIAGLVYFAILPSQSYKNLFQVFGVGAFFGLVTYATYDLTNLATLKDWPIQITVIDLIWGAFISGMATLLTHVISK
jgi:uncharacterized membrane protein